ncbi:non-hydrolyzing UDP-N-acetylglucosamine 2-epimerase [Fluoribacter gormanii]|uniref:non-hydrolyzing UDP-N-acetylglucosamine 2-epimerase n=1 Tax=Fluoribacter gormanii TaxID=464 RepID=UPI0024156C6B|nr:UDP-N-acetylglucosamine 2-epimerase (non-hydrolyzing) [Fluoribacter gormanii]
MVGTRPELIKMAPVIHELKAKDWANVFVINTAQHRKLIDDMFDLFHIAPDIDFNSMKANQSLGDLTQELVQKFDTWMKTNRMDMLLAVGDTTSVFVAALIAFYHHINYGHIEAGLRTYNNKEPFPEEMFRALTSKLATLNFASSIEEQNNLLKENINPKSIFITGNPVIDTINWIIQKKPHQPIFEQWSNLVVITAHRRENIGRNLQNICNAIKLLSQKFSKYHFVWPVHPNPSVQAIVFDLLNNISNVHLIEPLNYEQFIHLLNDSELILTDSGGIQEEAPILKKPVVILRNRTERALVVKAGLAVLAGTQTEDIVKIVTDLLENKPLNQALSAGISPYGDGKAAGRIVEHIYQYLLNNNPQDI